MSYLAADLRRVFRSKGFVVALFLLALMRLYVCLPEMLQSARASGSFTGSQGYLYFLFIAMLGPLRNVYLIISAAPFTFSYQADIESGVAKYLIQRKSFDQFVFYRLLSNMIATFLVSLLGSFLAITVLIGFCRGYPGSLPLDSPMPLVMLSQNKPLLYTLLISVNIALFAVVWSSFALLLSSLTRNLYVSFIGLIVGSELIGWAVLNRLISFSSFTWNGMYYGFADLGTVLLTESVIVLLYLAVAFFWGVLFVFLNKRRYRHAAL